MRSPLPRELADREWIIPIGFAFEPLPDTVAPPDDGTVGVLDDVDYEDLCRDLGVGD